MRKITILILSCLVFSGGVLAQKTKTQKPQAPNVILIIGDGMGLGQIYSLMSVRDQTAFEQFQHIGFSRTHSADDYTTDSGAGGTALATGKKTKNGYISVDPLSKDPIPTLVELCRDQQRATGVVTTCAITHATPAAFLAHNSDRNRYEAIADDISRSGVSLFIGGGKQYFEARKDQRNLSDTLRQHGYQVHYSMDQVMQSSQLPLAGLLWDQHPENAAHGRGDYFPQAVTKAIELLKQEKNGFFMMIESSQIDWTGHDNSYSELIEEMKDFDVMLKAVLDFARADGNTLVVVTADHETGGLALLKQYDPQNDTTSRVMHRYSTFDHSGIMVPVFAFGPGAERFGGIYQNTGVFDRILETLELAPQSHSDKKVMQHK